MTAAASPVAAAAAVSAATRLGRLGHDHADQPPRDRGRVWPPASALQRLPEALQLALVLWTGFPAVLLAGSVFHEERVRPC